MIDNYTKRSVDKGTYCKPLYIGTGGSSAVVINSLYCDNIVIPDTNPNYRVTSTCPSAGPSFTVTNIGDGDATSSVNCEVRDESSTLIDSGIVSPLGIGASVTYPYTTDESLTFTVGESSEPLTNDSRTSNSLSLTNNQC